MVYLMAGSVLRTGIYGVGDLVINEQEISKDFQGMGRGLRD